jgi:hypothetical protein
MKAIVTTTIFPPSEATKKFIEMEGWTLFVAGDKKTPHEEYLKYPNIKYLTPEYQEETWPELSDLIGWNCIQRRNLAYVEAYRQGATVIASVDDDNIPLPGWGQNLLLGQEVPALKFKPLRHPVFDPISATSYKSLWHRGYPLAWLQGKNDHAVEQSVTPVVDVQADFWNGDPDIDAICRIEHNPLCDFTNEACFPFFSDAPSPFNSQNTFFTRKSIKDFFLFPGVGRMDDIWGAYHCQSQGHRVVYSKPTVYQARNEHDLMIDFSKEICGYELAHKVAIDSVQKYIPEKSWTAFKAYQSVLDTYDTGGV